MCHAASARCSMSMSVSTCTINRDLIGGDDCTPDRRSLLSFQRINGTAISMVAFRYQKYKHTCVEAKFQGVLKCTRVLSNLPFDFGTTYRQRGKKENNRMP